MPIRLTRLEYELIETMALRRGALITRDEIMLQLDAWQDEPDAKIIDVYICRIRAKLAAAGATEDLISTSFSQGYRLSARPGEVLPNAA
jgi:DNA-binding response OmpR family regulator